MSDDATAVLWLDPGDVRDDAARALRAWALARGIRLENAAAPSPSSQHFDLAIADGVEKELDRAREAIGATDADAAERALARAETTLREHPELPQAAWLRAEVERTWAARWLRLGSHDEARARAAWENAHALDGGRVAGIGETAFPPRPRVKATIIVAGARPPRLSIRLDGLPLETTANDERGAVYQVDVAPADHHLLATADGRVLFASWISIAGADPAPTRVSLGDGGACSREQFAGVKRVDGDQVQASGVTCPRWVLASPGERRGSVLVARCDHDVCSPLLEWRVEQPSLPSGPPQAASKSTAWPTWATWALVGVGAATATSVAILATGVFETRAVEPRFVVGGTRQE